MTCKLKVLKKSASVTPLNRLYWVRQQRGTSISVAPKSIGRFKLEERLGAGGFGTVWKARDPDLDRVVAIKIPRQNQRAPTDVEQFYREARAAAQLRHPNIVPVYEVGRDGNQVFIVSDIIHGESLSRWLIDRRSNSQDVAQDRAQSAHRLVPLSIHSDDA